MVEGDGQECYKLMHKVSRHTTLTRMAASSYVYLILVVVTVWVFHLTLRDLV